MSGRIYVYLVPEHLHAKAQSPSYDGSKTGKLGGWQKFMTALQPCHAAELDLVKLAKDARLAGIRAAIENLEALEAAESDE